MAKTLLQTVNDILGKCESIDSDGEFSSLSDSGRQSWIDNAVRAANETMDLLYSLPNTPTMPNQVSSGTLTLVTNDQDYALASDVVRLLPEFDLIDTTNNHVIVIDDSPNAYRNLIIGDLEQNDTGLPTICAIHPGTGELWMDRKPTAAYNGNQYTYRYEKDVGLTLAADTVPFTNAVYRPFIVAATQQYMRINNRDYDDRYFNKWLAIAAKRLSQLPRRLSYFETYSVNETDPFEAA